MKTWIVRLTAALTFAALLSAVSARAQDNNGCTNATLHGDYAFTISGQIVHSDGTTDSRTGVAITNFDGAGHLNQVDFVMSSFFKGPVPSPAHDPLSGFHTNETGQYTVKPDCTGNATIAFPNRIVITLMFVVGPSGASIHTVVSSVTLPDGTSPGTPIIHSDGQRQPLFSEQATNTQSARRNRASAVSSRARSAKKERFRLAKL